MYEVLLTERAQRELDQAHAWWAENRSAEQADRWYRGFVEALLTLEKEPQRRALALESPFFPIEIRQLNYGLHGTATHRALYTVNQDHVVVLRIRHLAQELLTPDDL